MRSIDAVHYANLQDQALLAAARLPPPFVQRVQEHESLKNDTLLDFHDGIGIPSGSHRDRSNRVVHLRSD